MKQYVRTGTKHTGDKLPNESVLGLEESIKEVPKIKWLSGGGGGRTEGIGKDAQLVL